MALDPQEPDDFATFRILWEISSEQFAAIPTSAITKDFIISHENVPLRWCLELDGTEKGKMVLNIVYVQGILPELKLDYRLSAKKSNDANDAEQTSAVDLKFWREKVWRIGTFDMTTSSYELCLKIPAEFFRLGTHYLGFESKTKIEMESWIFGQFRNITDQDNEYSDVTLVSADGKKFYCHRVILSAQSKVFDALFRNPPTDVARKGVFDLPTVAGNVLEIALRYLYNGTIDLNAMDSCFADAFEGTNFADQYGLKELKETCIVYFWKNIGNNLGECVDLIRFADSNDDVKYLKDRAFDYLAENFKALSESVDIFNTSSDQDQRLQAELRLFMSQRLTESFRLKNGL